ncbi:MAG: hypothetical protein QUS12_12780 [Methanosarcina sp.]|nr:hypothetical protein [Methanosarcina sp.]
MNPKRVARIIPDSGTQVPLISIVLIFAKKQAFVLRIGHFK